MELDQWREHLDNIAKIPASPREEQVEGKSEKKVSPKHLDRSSEKKSLWLEAEFSKVSHFSFLFFLLTVFLLRF